MKLKNRSFLAVLVLGVLSLIDRIGGTPTPTPTPTPNVTGGCSQKIQCKSGAEDGAWKSCASDKSGGQCEVLDDNNNKQYGVRCRDSKDDSWTNFVCS